MCVCVRGYGGVTYSRSCVWPCGHGSLFTSDPSGNNRQKIPLSERRATLGASVLLFVLSVRMEGTTRLPPLSTPEDFSPQGLSIQWPAPLKCLWVFQKCHFLMVSYSFPPLFSYCVSFPSSSRRALSLFPLSLFFALTSPVKKTGSGRPSVPSSSCGSLSLGLRLIH